MILSTILCPTFLIVGVSYFCRYWLHFQDVDNFDARDSSPIFWDDVWVSKNIINWHKEGQFIDKFLNKYQAHDPVKYRFWESENRKMTYISINFPKEYTDNKRMFLKDILSEKNGVKFSVIFMKKILDTQVEK